MKNYSNKLWLLTFITMLGAVAIAQVINPPVITEDFSSDYTKTAVMAASTMTLGKLKTVQVSYDMSAGPSEATFDTALGGTATVKGAGYQATIVASLGGALYNAESDGTNWYYTEKTKAP
jgi:hypothetical protein